MDLDLIRTLKTASETKIVLLVLDGLGGLPREPEGLTELEAARTPNLDALAKRSITGLHQPVRAGITPGSGPAHLSLFGYDAVDYQVGRGVLSAAGIDFDLRPEDVACRGNFCTLDSDGRVTDRRAGRISTEKNRELVEKLRSIEIEGADVFVETIKEHRFLLVFRGEGLHAKVADTDPQSTGLEPLDAMASAADSERTAELANAFSAKARELLRDESPANMVLLRGFAELPGWPSFEEVYGTRSASIAAYPMYRGLAKLLGMTALDASEDPSDKFARLRRERDKYDFFFVHVKKPDATGEDGDFDAKLAAIEKADKAIPELLDAEPDVVVVTGDHSTPWKLKSHGWQPVPVLLYSEYCRPDEVDRFGERACLRGGLGPRIPATDLMPLAMANGLRLEKFGA